MKKIVLMIIVGLIVSTPAFAVQLPKAKITGYTIYESGIMLVKTNMDQALYSGPQQCPHDWYQVEIGASNRMVSALITAYTAGYDVHLLIDDNNCSSGSWPRILAVKAED